MDSKCTGLIHHRRKKSQDILDDSYQNTKHLIQADPCAVEGLLKKNGEKWLFPKVIRITMINLGTMCLMLHRNRVYGIKFYTLTWKKPKEQQIILKYRFLCVEVDSVLSPM